MGAAPLRGEGACRFLPRPKALCLSVQRWMHNPQLPAAAGCFVLPPMPDGGMTGSALLQLQDTAFEERRAARTEIRFTAGNSFRLRREI